MGSVKKSSRNGEETNSEAAEEKTSREHHKSEKHKRRDRESERGSEPTKKCRRLEDGERRKREPEKENRKEDRRKREDREERSSKYDGDSEEKRKGPSRRHEEDWGGRHKRHYKDYETYNEDGERHRRYYKESEMYDEDPPPPPPAPKKDLDLITSKTGGAYIPPGKLKLMQASITDKTSIAYQRLAWEALKKSIHGHINKVNTSNIGILARLLFKENLVRGRGLLCRSIIQAQATSMTFTNVYASLVAIINSKFPKIGELLVRRVIMQFKRGYKRGDKAITTSASTFIAHLVNQRVVHEIVALEMLTLLVENPTDDSVEIAVSFLKECGQKLAEVSVRGSNAIFDMLRNILHEGKLDKRVQYMIEVMFQVRKDEFRSFPSVVEDLDLVNEEDQFTHLITLEDAKDSEDILNVFKHDENYEENEAKYAELRKEILGDDDDDDDGEDDDDDDDEDDEGSSAASGDDSEEEEKKTTIIDNTETNLIALRKTIYLTIQSSLDFEECAHKLLKMEIKPGQQVELCHMLLDCCAEQRTYEKFFGLLAQRFCQINRVYVAPLEQIFQDSYATVHRLDTNKLRNVAKFFAHLLFTDAISWGVLTTVKLNEDDTTSSSRIFIKILFQELSEYMGLANLNARVKDPALQSSMEGLFPRDNPKNTRFAINFFTSIGLGGLTDELREHLKSQPKPSAVPQLVSQLPSSSSSSDSDSSSDSSSDDSSSEESSSSGDLSNRLKRSRSSFYWSLLENKLVVLILID
ncbi:hypothetical protein AAG570_001547 [Ranatra chinensis]|uniref:MI domain-containing protein n=1 Tax=Ranatra chinensis TaxID=642074 RepID=A0ABD0Y9M6_9HEMI